jgi:hypothetical protein
VLSAESADRAFAFPLAYRKCRYFLDFCWVWSRGSFTGSTLVLVGALHTITNIRPDENENPKAYPAFKYMTKLPDLA